MTRSAFTLALLILSSTSAAAEAKEPAPPQLYVRADVEYPEKGYIEKTSTTPGDANVSFRRCNDLQPIVVPKNKLLPTSGSCAPSGPGWVGTIYKMDDAGNATVFTTTGDYVTLSVGTLQKYPNIKATIGTSLGGVSSDEPNNLYAVQEK